MKRTCDMEIGEKFQQTIDGVVKNMIIVSKVTDANGFIIVRSSEVIA